MVAHNARLIAAAPDLLAALRRLHHAVATADHHDLSSDESTAIECARNAIAEATGGDTEGRDAPITAQEARRVEDAHATRAAENARIQTCWHLLSPLSHEEAP